MPRRALRIRLPPETRAQAGGRRKARAPFPRRRRRSPRSGRSCGVRRRSQTELARDWLHRVRNRLDVLVEVDAEELRTFIDLVAVHARRERRLLQLLLDRPRRQRLDPVRPDEAARVDEARQLVAGEERSFEIRVPWHRQVLGVGEHRLDQLLRVTLLAEDLSPVLRVLVERRVDLVIEVVQKRRRAPELLVAAELPCIGPHGGLDGEGVPQERLAFRVTSEGVPGLFASDFHVAQYHSPLVSTTLVADALIESFVIEGGRPLSGRVSAAGNKNGALPILAATLMASGPVVLSNVPRIRDVETMLELLADIGAEVDWVGANEVRVDSANASKFELDSELCSRIRASFLLAGPLLARFGRASVPPPGGDVIDLNGRFDVQTDGLRGRRIFLDEASVMATENAVMAAAVARGETVIGNAACEPHVQDLCRFLSA